jgi:hypothetical protein
MTVGLISFAGAASLLYCAKPGRLAAIPSWGISADKTFLWRQRRLFIPAAEPQENPTQPIPKRRRRVFIVSLSDLPFHSQVSPRDSGAAFGFFEEFAFFGQ